MSAKAKVVVTGATGHLGNVLVRELVARGVSVRAMILPGESRRPLDGLEVEIMEGDVRDQERLRVVFEGAGLVYHLAGLISILQEKKQLLHEINVLGTGNVIAACEACGVERMVYVSSVHALEEPPHGIPITETSGSNPERVIGAYAQSKARATRKVIDAIERGFNAVIVYPSGIIGPWDYNISEMGRLILDFLQRRLPAYVDGAYDFVDVRDVVNGIIAAGNNGGSGEGYLLSGELLTLSRLMTTLHELSHIPAPSVKVPYRLALAAACVAPLLARATGKPPRFTPYSLRVLRSNALMDCSKARRELAYTTRPLNESLADTIAWCCKSPYIS